MYQHVTLDTFVLTICLFLGTCRRTSSMCSYSNTNNISYVWDSAIVKWKEARYNCEQQNSQLAIFKDHSIIKDISKRVRAAFEPGRDYIYGNIFWVGASYSGMLVDALDG